MTQWRFDALSDEADSIRMRGETIETAGTRISARCSEMPALRAWQGLGHTAAQEAFARSKDRAVRVGAVADDVSAVLTMSYWELSAARQELLSTAEGIEATSFLVSDQWVITLRPVTMTRDEAAWLKARRGELQARLNRLVGAVGNADERTARQLVAAAKARGYTPAGSSVQGMIGNALQGIVRPTNDAPDPRTSAGLLLQQSMADADMAVTVASKSHRFDEDGNPVTTVVMQDGSRKVFTERVEAYGERTVTVEDFDPDGALVATMSTQPWGNDGTRTMISYADGTLVTIIDHADGRRTGSVIRPNEEEQELDSTFFSHPALTLVGGAIADVGAQADHALKKAPVTLTRLGLENISAGAKFGGPALAVGVALYDIATADTGAERCQASIAGLSGIVGGTVVGAGATLIPGVGPVLAGAGTVAGSWIFGWLGSKVGEAVCQ